MTESMIPGYIGRFPGLKVGDHIHETQIRTANKLIRSRTLNGDPIPWIGDTLTPEN